MITIDQYIEASDMPNGNIWMPLYIGDYLAKTTRLTTLEHGAYLLLIMDYWKNGPPPNDDTILSQITRLAPDKWGEIRHKIAVFFDIHDGEWRHSRIEEQKSDVDERQRKATNRAKAAADARWNATSNAQAMLDECQSKSQSKSQSKTNTEKRDRRFAPPTRDEVVSYFEENGYTKDSAIRAFKYYEEGDWHDSSGKKIRNWKQKMRGVWFKSENKKPSKDYMKGVI